MNLGIHSRLLVCVLTSRLSNKALLSLLVVASIPIQLGFAVGPSVNAGLVSPNVHAYKVALDVATLWGSGNYYHSEMLDSASKYGFDAVFFTDNRYFLEDGGVADPGFENVTSSGGLRNWDNTTLGNQGPIGITRVNRTLTRSGSSSIELALENDHDEWASRSVFQSWGSQSHRLHLFGNVLLKASVYVANSRLPPLKCERCVGSGEAWVYFQITLSTQGPHSGPFKEIYFIYEYRHRGTPPTNQNSTSSYYLYLTSPSNGWNDFSTNLTPLVKELWNQTIVDYWWIQSIKVGVGAGHGAYVDALFDDVSVTPTDDFASTIQYLQDSIIPSISTDTIKSYSGYSLSQSTYPFTVSILGGNTFQSPFIGTGVSSSDTIDLHGTNDWNRFSREVGDAGSLLLVDSPIDASIRDILRSSYRGLNLPVVDLSRDQLLWDQILSGGGTVMIAASSFYQGQAAFANRQQFADPDIWTTRVWAASNSEDALLEAIYLGHSCVARNGFNGQFELDSLGFEPGRLPVYLPQGTEAEIHLKISGIPGGTVHLISQGREVANATLEPSPSTGEFEETYKFGFDDAAYFRAVVTNKTGLPVIISNPIFLVHKPMLSGSYIYISDPAASVQSWNFTELFTRREVSIGLTAGAPSFRVSRNGSAMYIRLPMRESGYRITIANLTRPADSFYDNELGDYVVPLGGDLPIAIVLRLDKSVLQALVETGQGVMPLLGFVLSPFVIASVFLAVRAFAKRRGQKGT